MTMRLCPPKSGAVMDAVRRIRGKRLILFGNALGVHQVNAPSAQATVDLFAKEWASRFPPPLANLKAGEVRLFEDERITWAIEALGGVSDLDVLELGPLEAGHTFMLEQAGARSVLSVESNGRAYLKCLVVKELLGLQRAQFLLGDAMSFMSESNRAFDLCVASGILYHMLDPVAMVKAISERAPRLILWTHYYDRDVMLTNRRMRRKMTDSHLASTDGFDYTLYEHHYRESLHFAGFSGGTQPTSHWLSRKDLMRCLEHYGWTDIQTAFEQRDHRNGPCLALVARRDRPSSG